MADNVTDSESAITAEHHGSVLTITLNRPTRGNALRGDDAVRLAELIDQTSAETDTRAVLLRAEGKHFCTGADIGGAGRNDTPVNGHMVRSLARNHHRVIASVFTCRVPVVAAVQGAAMGFGLHLALAADLVVAGQRATFAEPFTERGFNVDSGGSWLLPRLVGLSRAKQMLYLAQPIDSATALSWGLISEVVEDDQVQAEGRKLAEALADRPTQAVAATKQLLHDGLGSDLHHALHAESMAVELTVRSRDFKEGMKAFMEKRPPKFTGR